MKRPHEHLADDDRTDDAQDGTRASRRRKTRQRGRAPIDLTESLFDLLPDELVVDILAATGDVGSIVNWSRTSRRHHDLANDPLLWRRLYETRFGAPLHADFARRDKDWQWLYRARACDGRVAGTSVGEISTTMAKSDTPALYWGDLADGVPHGYGLLVAASAASGAATTNYYEGGFYYGEYDGYGRRVWPGGGWHQGDYVANKAHGRGTYTRPNGDRYEGDFVKDKSHGHGVYAWPDGERYVGRYVDNKRHGHGVHTWPDGSRYEGTYVDGARHGRGVYARPDGRRSEVIYRNGKVHGHATHLYPDGSCARGHYVDGNNTGDATMTHGDRCAPTQPCMACTADPFGKGHRS
ncbi:Morn repeat domain containing protein [Pandoravirus dulcis]|uniref:Morn repeat domain containing protein n=1 Tax=Pandoravirus dulcis TaxID=1349409 RepID=S4VYA9_9VIRU|nr:Morn repeat domain containing protein [Pandoravirus dulcis]AGO82874.1 Morn repeat domain containing protein [Pandoravirus dulcis]